MDEQPSSYGGGYGGQTSTTPGNYYLNSNLIQQPYSNSGFSTGNLTSHPQFVNPPPVNQSYAPYLASYLVTPPAPRAWNYYPTYYPTPTGSLGFGRSPPPTGSLGFGAPPPPTGSLGFGAPPPPTGSLEFGAPHPHGPEGCPENCTSCGYYYLRDSSLNLNNVAANSNSSVDVEYDQTSQVDANIASSSKNYAIDAANSSVGGDKEPVFAELASMDLNLPPPEDLNLPPPIAPSIKSDHILQEIINPKGTDLSDIKYPHSFLRFMPTDPYEPQTNAFMSDGGAGQNINTGTNALNLIGRHLENNGSEVTMTSSQFVKSTSNSSLSPEAKGSSRLTKPLSSTSALNMSVLVKAVKNLSDVILLHCSTEDIVLEEQDQESLKQAVLNLTACIGKDATASQLQDEANKELAEIIEMEKHRSAKVEVAKESTEVSCFEDTISEFFKKIQSKILQLDQHAIVMTNSTSFSTSGDVSGSKAPECAVEGPSMGRASLTKAATPNVKQWMKQVVEFFTELRDSMEAKRKAKVEDSTVSGTSKNRSNRKIPTLDCISEVLAPMRTSPTGNSEDSIMSVSSHGERTDLNHLAPTKNWSADGTSHNKGESSTIAGHGAQADEEDEVDQTDFALNAHDGDIVGTFLGLPDYQEALDTISSDMDNLEESGLNDDQAETKSNTSIESEEEIPVREVTQEYGLMDEQAQTQPNSSIASEEDIPVPLGSESGHSRDEFCSDWEHVTVDENM